MNLVQFALRRPFSVVVLIAGVVIGAFLALGQMARDVFPSLGVPTIYVAQPFGGMDPAQMEGFLTYYYEYHFLYITGIEHVESKSIQGAAIIKLQFYPGTDMSQRHVRNGFLREPRARVHAARRGAAFCHALRCRKRSGRIPRLCQCDQNGRPNPGPRAEYHSTAFRDAAGRIGTAALWQRPAQHPRQCRSGANAGLRRFNAGYRCRDCECGDHKPVGKYRYRRHVSDGPGQLDRAGRKRP